MDADDICLPWRFEKQTQKISKTNSDFLFGNAILFGASLKPLGFAPQLPFGLTAIQGRLALLLGNPFVHPTMIAKASSMRELGGYREVPAEDYDLWLRAGIAGMRIERSRSYDVLYRVHSRQLTQQAFWQQRLEQDTQLHETRATLSEQLLGASKEASADPLQIYRELWDANGGGIAVKWSIFRTLVWLLCWQTCG
jgi:hypothetical protein